MIVILAGFHYLWETENFTIMGYTTPQNWNDEAMEYVNSLTDKINVGWDGEDYCLRTGICGFSPEWIER